MIPIEQTRGAKALNPVSPSAGNWKTCDQDRARGNEKTPNFETGDDLGSIDRWMSRSRRKGEEARVREDESKATDEGGTEWETEA